jgi:alkylation response protein AidB-like acyl-CoA dehydrogenase
MHGLPAAHPESHHMSHLALLEPIVQNTIAPAALETDREGRFPRAALQALGQAGLLGLVSDRSVGGLGGGLREAAAVVERIAQDCPSTAMVVCMHYAGTVLIEKHGTQAVRREIAAGRHVTTLAWSRSVRAAILGSGGAAKRLADGYQLDGQKSMVTSAGKPTRMSGPRSRWRRRRQRWLVSSRAEGLSIPARYDGLGLRGNASAPVTAQGVVVGADAMLGADGAGADIMNGEELPVFATLIATASIGLMEGALARDHHLPAPALPKATARWPICPPSAPTWPVRASASTRPGCCATTPSRPWRRGGRMRCCACWRSRPPPPRPHWR